MKFQFRTDPEVADQRYHAAPSCINMWHGMTPMTELPG